MGATEDDIALVMRLRRARVQAFGGELFGDIAWDILLQLFAARLGQRKVRLSDLEILAPKSTIARWAAVLEERGLISCRLEGLESNDLRVELSSAAASKMADLFDGVRLEGLAG